MIGGMVVRLIGRLIVYVIAGHVFRRSSARVRNAASGSIIVIIGDSTVVDIVVFMVITVLIEHGRRSRRVVVVDVSVDGVSARERGSGMRETDDRAPAIGAREADG